MRGIRVQLLVHCKKGVATEHNCVLEELSIALTEVAELPVVEESRHERATIVVIRLFEALFPVVEDFESPVQVTGIPLPLNLTHAVPGQGQLKMRTGANLDDVLERLDVWAAIGHSKDAGRLVERRSVIEERTISVEHLEGG